MNKKLKQFIAQKRYRNKSLGKKFPLTLAENDVWETPQETYHELCKKYQVFPLLDVACSTQDCKCKKGYYSDKGLDALSLDWMETVWCNPPHSETERWVRKAYAEWKKHNTTIMMIIPANTMSSVYWQDCIEDKAEYHTIEGRIKFLKDGNPSKYHSRNAYLCVIWRRKNG